MAQVTNESITILPKYVAFKGDNGKYLAATRIDSCEYLQFNTTDIGDGRVRHEVVPLGDGTVRLKCVQSNMLWKRCSNWIQADTPFPIWADKDFIFKPIQVNEHSVALQCFGNYYFCKRLTAEGKDDCLSPRTGTLESSTILRVEEPIMWRKVHSVVYDTDNAQIYDGQPLALSRNTVKNNSHQPTTLPVTLTYTDTKSSTWKNEVSLSTGIKTTFEAGIPLVADFQVEISFESTFSREWGETRETQTTLTTTYNAPVDPGQTVEVILKATQAKCNLKFSYVQEDLDTTGRVVESHKSDGVFIGANYTDIQYETRYY